MSPGDSTVLFRALPTRLKVSTEDQHSLAIFAAALSHGVADRRPFTCLITNNRALRKLNQQFLQHDYPTDVLSFPSEGSENFGEAVKNSQPVSLGDLAISIERADVQAIEFGHSRLDELRVLMLHGLLHLVGFNHETDRGQMARAEKKWRLHFGLPSNLIARAKQELAS